MRSDPLNPLLPRSPERRGTPLALAVICLAGGLLGAGAGPAHAAAAKPHPKPHSPLASRNLWATVDICSSTRHIDTIGIRGSMPGTGHVGEQMFMRFRAQFLSNVDHHWHYVPRNADTGFKGVGSGRFVSRQSGWSFSFHPPPAHGRYTLRGVVDFQWRVKSRVLLRTRRSTSAGHNAGVDAKPRGYSATMCLLH